MTTFGSTPLQSKKLLLLFEEQVSIVSSEGRIASSAKADFTDLNPDTIGTSARTRLSSITPINQKRPLSRPFCFIVAGEGFEPPTFGL